MLHIWERAARVEVGDKYVNQAINGKETAVQVNVAKVAEKSSKRVYQVVTKDRDLKNDFERSVVCGIGSAAVFERGYKKQDYSEYCHQLEKDEGR